MERVRLTFQMMVVAASVLAVTIWLVGRGVIAAPNFGRPVSGQHIYDRAGALTSGQIATLEQHARSVEEAGAPVIVYLQAQSASYNDTERDAVELMQQWDVQSAPGAKNGLVVFFNLNPDDLHHGQVALYAGQTHFDGGNLPEYELRRIFNQIVKPDLAAGNLAGGIAAGLDAAASSLRNGPPPPPPPSAAERYASRVSDGPFSVVTLIAVAVAALLSWFAAKVFRTRPRSNAPIAATTKLPDNTAPAVVGAVFTGRVRDRQLEATILDLAHRGALVIESGERHNRAQVRLLDPSIPDTNVERQVWHSLENQADADGIVTSRKLASVRSGWSSARKALATQLKEDGLYDPRAANRRRPVYAASLMVAVVAAVMFVIGLIGKQPWAFVAAGLSGAAAIAAAITMTLYPDTSQEGADLAGTWRSYVEGIRRSKSDETLSVNLDLDEAMPYAVAAGVTSSLRKRLKQAAEAGYMPIWLGPALYRSGNAGNAYIWWTSFHAAVTPSSGGGSSGAGGAAAGGGGAGGSF